MTAVLKVMPPVSIRSIEEIQNLLQQIAQKLTTLEPKEQVTWSGRTVTVVRSAHFNKNATAIKIQQLDDINTALGQIALDLCNNEAEAWRIGFLNLKGRVHDLTNICETYLIKYKNILAKQLTPNDLNAH